MSKEVKRYEPTSGYDSTMRKLEWMCEAESGGYVSWDAYEVLRSLAEDQAAAVTAMSKHTEKLQAERDALLAERDGLQARVDAFEEREPFGFAYRVGEKDVRIHVNGDPYVVDGMPVYAALQGEQP